MLNKPGAIIGLLIGCGMILFRKQLIAFIFHKQLERAKPKTEKLYQQLKGMKLERALYRMGAIIVLAIGVFLVLMNLSEFFPQAGKYIRYLVVFFIMSFFAAGAAAIVEFTLIFHWLWGNVRKYVRERYPDCYWSVETSSGSDKLNVVRSGPKNDPVLRSLRQRATIYTVVCFVVLFVIFLLAFYGIFKVTS